ncbi:MAG TPA: family 20 glycosylhydrolase, partial [Methanoculleus sp.]|nr:family 20 glycosylhydrolase [Methanoculleus sp.]
YLYYKSGGSFDILAWHKLNLFHWHLTDDEGWRAEIKAYPELTDTGAHRSAETDAMLPQLAL